MENDEVTKRLNEALRMGFGKRGVQLKSDMAKALGYKSPYFSGITTGKEKLTNAFLENLSKNLGVNPRWVLTGEGEMFGKPDEEKRELCMVPLVPVSAHGGSLTNFSQQVRLRDCEMMISPIDGVDLAVPIIGDSMAPEYPNGSIALIKKIDANAFIEWGKAYVLDTRNGLVIKVLVPSDKPGSVKCISVNPSPIFAPFDVDMDDVLNVYAVKACVARK